MTELGIVDIREIFRVIKNTYDYDFSNYALTSIKQRLERIMMINNLRDSDTFIKKLQNSREFFDDFLYQIEVPSTEMFRDPSLWRWLREEYFEAEKDKHFGKFKIWIPNSVSGGELYSLAILLNEIKLLEKVHIIVSCISSKSIELIKEGQYELKKVEISKENYTRFQGDEDFSKYYNVDRYFAFRETSFIKNVEFYIQKIDYSNSPSNVKLILFRNHLIYYNPSLQEEVLKIMYKCLSASGHLIIGIKERIRDLNTKKEFELINESESIYRKKIPVNNNEV